MEFKRGYYQANLVSGVVYIGNQLECANTGLTPPQWFYDSLDTLERNETITAFFEESDKVVFDAIVNEYGIN